MDSIHFNFIVTLKNTSKFFVLGVQGNVLLNFIPPIDISSITVSLNYSADVLARGLCCRLERPTNHPWICHGPMEGILLSTSQNDWRKGWAMYWSHANMGMINFYFYN